MTEQLMFNILSFITVATAISVILTRNPVISATLLIAHLFSIACLYALLGAHFVAAIQVLVYAGAIMVLFLFVIMLLNLKKEQLKGPKLPAAELIVMIATVMTFIFIGSWISNGRFTATAANPVPTDASNTFAVGIQLFTKYLWPFELASFLILMAIIASVVIARKERVKKI